MAISATNQQKKQNRQTQAASAGINAPATTSTAPKIMDPSATTKSFYTNPSTINNYDKNRPVYTQSQALKDAANTLAQYEQAKPADYSSRYDAQIQGMIDNIMNRPAYSYDFAADPLYQQYADQYQRRGQLAMRDSMAQSAALTGGYGNSYAQQVGQQTYQRYLEDLNAIIPQLEGQAYQRYRDAGDVLQGQLGILQGADSIDYGRYRDGVGDWKDELSYYYNKFNDMSDDEYNVYLNDSGAWERDRDYWAQQAALQAAGGGSSGGGGRGSSRSVSNTQNVNALSDAILTASGGLGYNGQLPAALIAAANELEASKQKKGTKRTGGGSNRVNQIM